jgi:hypothetical protein
VRGESLKLQPENMLTMNFPNFTIQSNGSISQAFLQIGITDFQQACFYVKNLRYKRTSVKSNLLLVLEEKRGTCSSKHALLKKLAEENDFDNIQLTIGIYKMTPQNTPGIGNTIPAKIQFIPEAHTYLVFDKHRMDFTRAKSRPLKDEDILQEMSIDADEISLRKEQLHKGFMAQWCKQNNLDFNAVWKIREACIEKLSC